MVVSTFMFIFIIMSTSIILFRYNGKLICFLKYSIYRYLLIVDLLVSYLKYDNTILIITITNYIDYIL